MKENALTRTDLFASSDAKYISPLKAINFCLDQLDADCQKSMSDEVAKDCTYEELIHALVLAKEELTRQKEIEDQKD
jgi:hypothetical protein